MGDDRYGGGSGFGPGLDELLLTPAGKQERFCHSSEDFMKFITRVFLLLLLAVRLRRGFEERYTRKHITAIRKLV